MRRRRRRHRARPVGLRGGPERRRRHLRLVRRPPAPRPRTTTPRRPPASTSTSTSPRLAAGLPVGGHGLVALDWHSGNRSVLVDHDLSGVVVGLTLATTPEEIYLALLESTAFGTRTIIESFEASGVAVDEFVVVGGLLKNSFLMQLYADVIRRPIGVITSDQGPALGSAIHAAVAAGAYPDIRVAAKAMGKLERGALHARPGPGRGVRPAVRRVRDPPRLLRPRRQRRHAPPAGDAAGGAPVMRRRLSARLARGRLRPARRARAVGARHVDERQRQRSRAGSRPDGDQADRRRLPRADPGVDGGHRPARPTGRRRASPRRRTPSPTPSSTARCRP